MEDSERILKVRSAELVWHDLFLRAQKLARPRSYLMLQRAESFSLWRACRRKVRTGCRIDSCYKKSKCCLDKAPFAYFASRVSTFYSTIPGSLSPSSRSTGARVRTRR